MAEMVHTSSGHAADAATLLNQFRITDDDLDLVRTFGKKFKPEIKTYVEEFYDWLTVQPFFQVFPERTAGRKSKRHAGQLLAPVLRRECRRRLCRGEAACRHSPCAK